MSEWIDVLCCYGAVLVSAMGSPVVPPPRSDSTSSLRCTGLNAEEHSSVAVVSDAAVGGHEDDDDVTAETREGDKGGNREAGDDMGTEAVEDNAVERGIRPCI